MPSTYDKARRTEAAGHSRFSSFFSVAARGGKRPRESVVSRIYCLPVGTVNRVGRPVLYGWRLLPDHTHARPVTIEQLDTVRAPVAIAVGPDLHDADLDLLFLEGQEAELVARIQERLNLSAEEVQALIQRL